MQQPEGLTRSIMFDYVPVKLLIDYKMLLMVDKVVNGLGPRNLIDFLLVKGHPRILLCLCNFLNLPLAAVIAF